MTKRICNIYLLTLWIFCVEAHDYYWRDYTGVIPEDALAGARDANGNLVYIGQVYVHCYGLCISPIVPGKKEVQFYCWGNNTLTENIKILCTEHPENFVWVRTNSSRFHLDMINKHTVIGGYDGHAEVVHNYNIGRLKFNGVEHIGIVDSVNPERVPFYFHYKGKNYEGIDNYEVLVFDENASFTFDPRTKTL